MNVDLAAAAAPKSDQINADDLIASDRVVTITEVRRGNAEQPVEIVTEEFGPGRPYRPGKSMIRVLLEVWGSKSETYVGRRLRLYRDPEITFGPQKVGGIRISHMSHMDRPKSIALTVTRGRKGAFKVEPLPAGPPLITDDQAAEIATQIVNAPDLAALSAISAQLKTFDLGAHKDHLLGLGKTRMTELKAEGEATK